MRRALLLSLLIASSAFGQVFGGYFPGTRGTTSSGGGSGVTTIDSAPTGSNANGLVITGSGLHCSVADASNPGCQSSANFSKANAAATSVGTVSGTSTANGLDLTANVLTAHVGDAANPGLLSTAWADFLAHLVPVRHPKTMVYQPGGANSVNGVAGQVYLEQVEIGPVKGKPDQISFLAGTTPGGQITMGIYGPITNGTCLGASLIAQSADTAGSGGATNNMQIIPLVSPAYVFPGVYCLAMETNGTSVQFYRQVNARAASESSITGGFQAFSQTYGALPATVPTLNVSANGANDFPLLDVRVLP